VHAVPITPEVNHLIRFIRDAYLPGLYITSYMKFKEPVRGAPRLTTIGEGFHVAGRRQAAKVWDSMKEELSDEGRALAWISSYIPVLARYSSRDTARDLNLTAIKMKAKSLKILTAKIARLPNDSPPDVALVAQIVSLFRASCKEGDLESAKIHAEIIRRLIDRVGDGQPPAGSSAAVAAAAAADRRHLQVLFVTVMNNDTEIAVSQMRNTFFDFEHWVQKQLSKFWADTSEAAMPPTSSDYRNLHSSIEVQSTRVACVRLRRYLLTRQTLVNLDDPHDLERTDSVLGVFIMYSLYDSGVLVNNYMDLVGGRRTVGGKSANSVQLLEALVALTTLHVLRRGIFEATIYGGDYRIGYHVTTVAHLQATARTALEVAPADELGRYGEALLWIFFYGARFEWQVAQKTKKDQDKGKATQKTKCWFTSRFARQTQQLGLTQWPDARRVLDQFVFYEFLEPDLPAWYDEVVSGLEESNR
jgi:hypothetical protein